MRTGSPIGRKGFQFKQFSILHDKCTMKVCTDSCIFGAWLSNKIAANTKILDIGAGSGLLTLMLAQKGGNVIHAIEKDESSFLQMEENIKESQWKDKISPFWGDVMDYTLPGQYDFIVCNPPFFENNLKSGEERKNLAKHDIGLTLDNLTQIVSAQLKPSGSFGILLPYYRTKTYDQIALSQDLILQEKLLIRQTPKHEFFRSILLYSWNKISQVQTSELIIKEEDDRYSTAFISLLKPYYLYL